MWVATTSGFYSIVEKPIGNYQVRSRHKQDLKNLLVMTGLEYEIKDNEGTDYEYRIHCTSDDVLLIMKTLGERIDYSNFKSEVEQNLDQLSKLDAYHKFWVALLYTSKEYLSRFSWRDRLMLRSDPVTEKEIEENMKEIATQFGHKTKKEKYKPDFYLDALDEQGF